MQAKANFASSVDLATSTSEVSKIDEPPGLNCETKLKAIVIEIKDRTENRTGYFSPPFRRCLLDRPPSFGFRLLPAFLHQGET